MRRVLTILTAVVLVVSSLAVGTLTADLPFWRRAFDLPLGPRENFVPSATIGSPPAGAVAAFDPQRVSFDPDALSASADAARAAGADTLLVDWRGELQAERYFRDPEHWAVPRPADFLARPLAAMAVGIAIGNGRIASLDTAVSRYLPEWDDEPRGRITLRQLLNETSGLATAPAAAQLLGSHPFADWSRLPEFATSRGVRLLLGNDFESTALGFRQRHEAGGFFNESPVNAQLAAVVVERASGMPYEQFLQQHLLAKANFSAMQFQMDRRSGMPAAHCCMRVFSRDALALGRLMLADGVLAGGERVLPAGWVEEMLRGSRANPEFGLQVERLERQQLEIWHLGAERGGGLWIVPARQLTIAVLADRDVRLGEAFLDPLLSAAVRK